MKQDLKTLPQDNKNSLFAEELQKQGFHIELTRDGSPTLLLTAQGESMHHSGGAASETWYIYGLPLRAAFKRFAEDAEARPLRTVCVGLGLGYVELVYGFLLATDKALSSQHEFDSFEKVSFLRDSFISWLKNQNLENSGMFQMYDSVLQNLTLRAPAHLGERPDLNAIKITLRNELEHLRHRYRGDLFEVAATEKWNLICFDAFSKKTNETLWTSDFLENFIIQHCEEDCVFTTYACTGDLKKVLEKNNFLLLNRPGFSGKRESTLALRGRFKSRPEIFQTF